MENKTESKVFCNKCKYFINIAYTKDINYPEKCIAPENLQDSYKEPGGILKSFPSDINQNNKCPSYKEK